MIGAMVEEPEQVVEGTDHDDVRENELDQEDHHIAVEAVALPSEGEQEQCQQAAEDETVPMPQQQDAESTSQADVNEQPNDAESIAEGRKRKATQKQEAVREQRPRWYYGDKSLDEVTMKDVETLVRRCNSLSKKVEVNAEAANQLKELQNAKKAIEKQVVLTTGPEVVARAKACIAKQFLSQMVYVFAWNDELRDKNGRAI